MKKVIVIVGFGPGTSRAIAEKFGREGFAVALVGRTRERLDAGVAALKEQGIEAAAFVADAGNPASITSAIESARSTLGPITALQWTAYSTPIGDVTTASPDEVRAAFDVPLVGLVAALQAALPDLEAQKGSLLVTNGGLGFFDPEVDKVAVSWGAMGLALGNAAKHKLVGLLAQKLPERGVHVGEVVITGTVKGTAFDQGNATIDPTTVANAFWSLHTERSQVSVTI